VPNSDNGIVSRPSNHSVDQTLQKLQEVLRVKGVKVFAIIDHSGEAEKVGLQMRPTKVVIFGNPTAGTPVMLAAPTLAIDLPLKIMIWEDGDGKVQISYNSPAYLQARHNVPSQFTPTFAVVEALASAAAG
jgi:uncharacterized protein (DUF302 family)